jgi:hypothetical protein
MASEGDRRVEPMFDTKKTLSSKAADATDLIIDFATLGEYGLEPVNPPSRPCEGRRRSGAVRSSGSWHAAINRFAAQS